MDTMGTVDTMDGRGDEFDTRDSVRGLGGLGAGGSDSPRTLHGRLRKRGQLIPFVRYRGAAGRPLWPAAARRLHALQWGQRFLQYEVALRSRLVRFESVATLPGRQHSIAAGHYELVEH